MVVEYDEEFFRQIPEEWVRELRTLSHKQFSESRQESPTGITYTGLWDYAIQRGLLKEMDFDQFEKHISGRYDNVAPGFTIPPILSAPKSDRIFAPGFYMPGNREIYAFLGTKDFSPPMTIDVASAPIHLVGTALSRNKRLLEKISLSRVGRLHSIWQTFYDSLGDKFLDDPSITLPRVIVHGETMKGHDGVGSAHFDIADLMQKLGEKYSIPVYSLEREVATR